MDFHLVLIVRAKDSLSLENIVEFRDIDASLVERLFQILQIHCGNT